MDNDFVDKYLNLVRKIAHSFKSTGLEFDDLVQEGLIGLYEAHKKFDEKRGATFITFATHCIKNRILAYIKQEQKHSAAEISDFNFVERISDQQEITKISHPQCNVDTQNPQNHPSLNFPENMPILEKQIIALYFIEKKTLYQISEILEISREKARQLKNKAMRRYKFWKYKKNGIWE